MHLSNSSIAVMAATNNPGCKPHPSAGMPSSIPVVDPCAVDENLRAETSLICLVLTTEVGAAIAQEVA